MKKEKEYSIRKRRLYTPEDLRNAKKAIADGMGISNASRVYGVPSSTLSDHKLKIYASDQLGGSTYLDKDVETLLANSLLTLAKWGFGLNLIQLQSIVKDYLLTTGTKNKFKDCTPGRTWFRLFRKRHANLSLRVAQNFPLNRAEALSKEILNNFFKMVQEKYNELEYHNKPTHIFNVDETGFSGDQGKQLILCEKGESMCELLIFTSHLNNNLLNRHKKSFIDCRKFNKNSLYS